MSKPEPINRNAPRYSRMWAELRASFPPDLNDEQEAALRRAFEGQYAGTISQAMDNLELAWADFRYQLGRAMTPDVIVKIILMVVAVVVVAAIWAGLT